MSHLPSNLCFRKSKRAFCIMSVTFAEVRKTRMRQTHGGRERERETHTQREKSMVREVEGKGTVTEEKPHHIQTSPGGSYRCSPGLIFKLIKHSC